MQELGYNDNKVAMSDRTQEDIRDYLDYLSALVNTGTINANIQLITSGGA